MWIDLVKPRPKWSTTHSTHIIEYISPAFHHHFCDLWFPKVRRLHKDRWGGKSHVFLGHTAVLLLYLIYCNQHHYKVLCNLYPKWLSFPYHNLPIRGVLHIQIAYITHYNLQNLLKSNAAVLLQYYFNRWREIVSENWPKWQPNCTPSCCYEMNFVDCLCVCNCVRHPGGFRHTCQQSQHIHSNMKFNRAA